MSTHRSSFTGSSAPQVEPNLSVFFREESLQLALPQNRREFAFDASRQYLNARFIGLSLFILTFLGCSAGDQQARYQVNGKVTYQGQPVEKGIITFEPGAAGQVNSSPLGAGGSYSTELPAGDYRVYIAPPLVEGKGTPDSPPDEIPDPSVKNIPKKYHVPETSKLTAQVDKDKREFNFDLKP